MATLAEFFLAHTVYNCLQKFSTLRDNEIEYLRRELAREEVFRCLLAGGKECVMTNVGWRADFFQPV